MCFNSETIGRAAEKYVFFKSFKKCSIVGEFSILKYYFKFYFEEICCARYRNKTINYSCKIMYGFYCYYFNFQMNKMTKT